MPFTNIRYSGFRNLEDTEIGLKAERVFLVGENGQGKTNFLEALYYLSFGSSFRGTPDSEATKKGLDGFSLMAKTTEGLEGSMPEEEIRVAWNHGLKDIKRSGKKVADRKELVEHNPAIVFCHEDFSFAAGEPERRRFFFDQTAGLVSGSYIDSLRAYKRILKQRNAALKERRLSILELLDEQLAVKGLELMADRRRLETDLCEPFSDLYEAVSLLGQPVGIRYRPSWPVDASLDLVLEKLSTRRPDELALGTSLSGPHRDRWHFTCEGQEFSQTASTGQLRLLTLALRSLQARYYTERGGRKPVLLFDDVLLELDPEKRKRFLSSLPDAAQAIFTFLPGERWEDYRCDSMIVYRVEHGRFSR
jgi:DNA replication and repair protein RecF